MDGKQTKRKTNWRPEMGLPVPVERESSVVYTHLPTAVIIKQTSPDSEKGSDQIQLHQRVRTKNETDRQDPLTNPLSSE